eukprot:906822-Amphidinium_carterae.1
MINKAIVVALVSLLTMNQSCSNEASDCALLVPAMNGINNARNRVGVSLKRSVLTAGCYPAEGCQSCASA